MYLHLEDFVFARLGQCLARLRFSDEVLLPPRAIKLCLAAQVDHFD